MPALPFSGPVTLGYPAAQAPAVSVKWTHFTVVNSLSTAHCRDTCDKGSKSVSPEMALDLSGLESNMKDQGAL